MDAIDKLVGWLQERRLLSLLIIGGVLLLFVPLLTIKQFLVVAPGVLLAAAYVAYNDLKLTWLLAFVLLPASVSLSQITDSAAIAIPSDFIAIGLLFALLLKGRTIRRELGPAWTHPILLAIGLRIVWMLFTSATSEMPVVSIKFWLNNLWFTAGFLVFSILVFKRKPDWWNRWIYAAIPLLVLVLLVIIGQHALAGFSFKASYTVVKPFFHEKTSYAASIAVFVTSFTILACMAKIGTWRWAILWAMAGLSSLAVVLSFTRGAWLGVIAGLGVWVLLKYWRRLKVPFLLGLGVGGLVLWLNLSQGVSLSNDDGQHDKRTLSDHLNSVFDTKTNLSNRERINRWVAAIGMAQARPWVGWGPGTYQFQYAPFQWSKYKTWVSTNRGDVGTAHNEFLLASAEQGWLGGVLFALLLVVTLGSGCRGYLRADADWKRGAYAIAIAGLLTFYMHSFVNNFLDMDKVNIPIYTCMALIVALDRFYPPGTPAPNSDNPA
jgi:O-antigen ligase